jgi:hypothetical protein
MNHKTAAQTDKACLLLAHRSRYPVWEMRLLVSVALDALVGVLLQAIQVGTVKFFRLRAKLGFELCWSKSSLGIVS